MVNVSSGDDGTSGLSLLERDGFQVVHDMSDADDLALIRDAIDNLLEKERPETRELGVRGGAPQILEVARVVRLAPAIARSRFYANAKAYSEAHFRRAAHCHFDHVIIKPPMNRAETAWHQDLAYSHRASFAARRLHWWLPLQDATLENGCMSFVRGSHLGRLQAHTPVAANSDAVKTILDADADVVDCPIPAGSATVHLPMTLHKTGPNGSNGARYAFIAQFAIRTWLPRFVRW